MPPDIWPPGVSLHVATDVMTQARGKKTTGSPHNWPIMRALKKIAACLLKSFTFKNKARQKVQASVILLRITSVRGSMRHHLPAQCQPSVYAGPPLEPAHLQRHPADNLINQTRNVIFHTSTKPAPGMALSTAATAASRSMGCEPAPREAALVAPQTTPGLAQGHSKLIAKAAVNEVRMLLSDRPSGKTKWPAGTGLLDALTQSGALQRHAMRLFNNTAQPAQLKQLLQQSYAALLAAEAARHSIMSPMPQVLLLQHLAHVSAGDAGRALAALIVLQKSDFLPLAGNAHSFRAQLYPGIQCASSTQSQLDALSVAARLASSRVEFDTLLSVMKLPLSGPQRDSLKRLLEATADVECEQGRQVDILHHAMPAWLWRKTSTTTLAQTVLRIEVAALQRSGDMYAHLSAADKSALFSWHNGFRRSGAGSDLAQAQTRLYKMLKYIARANHKQDLLDVGFDRSKPLVSSKQIINARARIAAARLNQAIGRKKSPLTVLAPLGINNAMQKHPEDDLMLLYQSSATAVRLLHACLDEVLASTPQQAWREQLLDVHGALPSAVEHAAILAHWAGLLERYTPLGHHLDQAAVHVMADKIAAHYRVELLQPTIEAKLSHWIGRELKISDLQHWAQVHHAPLLHPARTQETELGRALRLAHDISSSSSRPRDLTTDGLHQFMRTYLQEHNVGNPVTLTNGSVIGLSTAPVSLSLAIINQALAPMLPATLAPRLDAHASRAHNAVVNFGSTTHGFEVFIGTQTQTSAALSASIDIRTGPFFSYIGGQAGAGATASVGANYIKTRGVMVRSLRQPNADGSAMDTAQARTDIVAFTDLMFAIAKGQYGSLHAEAVWKKIAERFFTSKSLSIGWHDQKQLTPHLTGTAGGYSRLGVGSDVVHNASTGLSLTHTLDWTPAGSNSRLEHSGASRMLRNTQFSRLHHVSTSGAASAGSAIPIHVTGADTKSLSLPQLSKMHNYLESDKGFSAIFRTLVTQGRLSETHTLRDLEQRDADAFAHALQEPACYAQYLQIFKGRYGTQHGEQKLEEFVAKIKNWAGAGQRYVMRSRLREDVRGRLDECLALANALYRQDAQNPALQELSPHMQQLLCDDASWMPIEIMALETQTARATMGINFGLQFAAQDAVVSERELSFVGLPLPLANDWVRATRAVAAPIEASATLQQTTPRSSN